MEKKTRGARNAARTRLKAVRVDRGLTQLEVATRAGVSLRTLQALEAGAKNINLCAVGTVVKLCRVLECDIFEVLEDGV